MAEVGSAFVSILPSAKGFGSKLGSEVNGELGTAGKTAGQKFGTALKVGALAVAGGAVLVGGFLKGAIGEAREAQKVGALTNAVIKSTGGVANVTAKQVDSLATSISLKTGVDDEAIASGENMLMTFTNVRNEVGKGNDIFNQATIAASDMAAAFGGDATSNSKMLGKALNDPTAGVSALTRVGVSFTQQQKDQIKTLQESGNILGAQKIILGEVTKQTGGAAEASATAGDKFKVAFDNFRESVGTAILPLVDKVLEGLTGFAILLTNDVGPGIAALNGFLVPVFSKVKAFFSAFVGYASQAIQALNPFGSTINVLKDAFSTIGGTIARVFGGSGGATGGLSSFGAVFQDKIIPALNLFGYFLRNVAIPAVTAFITGAIEKIAPVLKTASATFTGVVLPAVTAFVSYIVSNLLPIVFSVAEVIGTKLIPIIVSLAQFFYGTVYPAVVKIVSAIASNLKPVFDQLVATIQANVLPALVLILDKFREWQPTIQKVVMIVLKVIGVVLVFAAKILGVVLPVVIRFAGFLISKIVPAVIKIIEILAKVIGWLIKVGVAVFKALTPFFKFEAGVAKVVGSVIGFVADLVGKVAGFYGKIAGVVIDGIQAWVRWEKGIADKVAAVLKFVGGIPGKVVSAIGDLRTTLLNSGEQLIQGLIDGIGNKIGEAVGKVRDGLSQIRGLLPGSPIKWGPLKGWNNTGPTGPGGRLMGNLAAGISSNASAVDRAMVNVAGRINAPRAPQLALAGVASSSPLAAGVGRHLTDQDLDRLVEKLAPRMEGALYRGAAEKSKSLTSRIRTGS